LHKNYYGYLFLRELNKIQIAKILKTYSNHRMKQDFFKK